MVFPASGTVRVSGLTTGPFVDQVTLVLTSVVDKRYEKRVGERGE